jgi:2-dehydro-3-deoxyphosphogluconate aldolase/(4S)-4-hydroxy-2-oxoglutarate aldolase
MFKQKLIDHKIIAIIRGVDSERIVNTVGALLKGGIKAVEVTFNQQDAMKMLDTLKCLKLIKEAYGDQVYLGAGTVLTTDQVISAVDAGAEYIISPNVDVQVIQKTKELGKLSLPGAFTPSEIVTAYHAGADIIKLFPAGNLGISYIKALLAPLSHIPIFAVGGVNVENANEFIKAGAQGVGVGGSLVDNKAIYSGEYSKITHMAQAYVQKLQG